MLDVEELERQWKKYQRKKQRPLYIGGFLVLFLVVIMISIANNKINIHGFNIKNIFDNPSSKTVENNITNNKKKVYAVSKSIFLLNDSFQEVLLSKKKLDTKQDQNILVPLDEDELYIEKDISKPIVRKKKVSIIKVSNSNAYRDVERRFKRSHNINDSMFLADMYYKKRRYKKAIYWAMQTNKLNKNIEESWLIFAKSKVKLGRKNEAIRVLKAYIKRSNSYEARKLLKKIINN